MADRSSIEWTESTWNPTTGCDRTSAGCDHCYALTLSKRLKAMGIAKYQHDGDPRTSGPGFGVTIHPEVLEVPRTWRAPRVVFVNSMSDLFHDKVPTGFIRDVFAVMADTPQHTYQVLTKRSRRLAKIADTVAPGRPTSGWASASRTTAIGSGPIICAKYRPPCGSYRSSRSSGSGARARPRRDPLGDRGRRERPGRETDGSGLGEGDPRCCVDAGVAFFFKQWGGRTPKAGGRELDGRTWDERPGVLVPG